MPPPRPPRLRGANARSIKSPAARSPSQRPRIWPRKSAPEVGSGRSAHIYGPSVDTNGPFVDTRKSSGDTNGSSVDARGPSVDTRKSSGGARGPSVDTPAPLVDTNGSFAGINLPTADARDA